jgi:carbon storage regulator
MLVFSRRKNEGVVISSDITLTVLEIRGDKVRLGITCPKEIPVHRGEFFGPPRPKEEVPFLKAITDEPGDEGARLVFADWLEERGDPLGEFLRNQCQLAKATPQVRKGLERRQQALWAEHGAGWRASFPAVLWSFPAEPPA